MKALILNIGDEVLSGRVINTNSSFLALELNKIGVEVEKVVVVGDNENLITKEIDDFKQSNLDILITTGGLGPTHDDITKEVLCKNLDLPLELNESAKNLLDSYFPTNMAQCNLKQAYFPKDAIIIDNKVGTADGAIIERENKIYIILVGPPYEMIPMVKDTVIPYLQKRVGVRHLVQEFILMGSGESSYEEMLIPIYKKYPNISINPYASTGRVRFQINGLVDEEKEFKDAVDDFTNLMKDYIISSKNEEIEEVVVNRLKEKNYSISFCESCTGGMLASKIINVSGASSVINESLVTYSNEAKIKYLQVNPNTIEKYGVVSDEVVKEMAEGLYKLTKANVCVSVSGVAGPTGGTEAKPVGLVHYAIKINDKIISENKIFKGNRDLIRTKTSLWVLYRIFCLLKQF